MFSNSNYESENHSELRAMTDEEIEVVSGGRMNGDNPVYQAFLAGAIHGASSGGLFVFPVCNNL